MFIAVKKLIPDSAKRRIRDALSLPIRRDGSVSVPNLAGDRRWEWTWIAVRIGRHATPSSRILDFGSGLGVLSQGAASIGAHVLAVDLVEQFANAYPNIEFRKCDVRALDPATERFDLILNCSTIEHVGLSGRYEADGDPDGDLKAMVHLRELMELDAHMIMTLPVGRDAVIHPFHRVYGAQRLPELLKGFDVLESSFARKDRRNFWMPCSRDEALSEEGTESYYGLGMFVLRDARV